MRKEDESKLAVNIIQFIFALILIVMICVSFVGCGSVKYVPVGTETVVEYRDTTIFVKDTITIEVPKEVVKEVVPALDTSIVSTSLAESIAYLDTTKRSIYHKIEQKGSIPILYDTLVTVKYVDRYINKEIPIEVVKEVKHIPNWCWYSLIFNVVIVLFIAFRIYLKTKKVL